MKTVNLLFLFVISLVIFSCSKEDEKPSFDEDLLKGEWEISELDYSGTTETSVMGISTTATFVGTMIESDLQVSFSQDPNECVTTGDYTIELETTTDGQTVTTESTQTDFLQDGEWSVSGDKLTLSVPGSPDQEATILQLSDTKLVLEFDANTSFNLSGMSVSTDTYAKYSLLKK